MRKIRVGITMGDPSGIGPEIISKALAKEKILNLADFVVIGDKWVFDQVQNVGRRTSHIEFSDLKNIPRKGFRFGRLNKEYGRASLEYIDKALELIKEGSVNCLVTSPVSKEAISLSGVDFVGHTEYLRDKTNKDFVVMMLVVDKLRVSLVTRHIPLIDVSLRLTSADMFNTIRLSHQGLKKFFGIKQPKIAVCGLNPHSGEGGLLGKEEEKIIIPAINKANRLYKQISGPLAADSLFSQTLINKFDCIIAMYHDQGLIPVKMLGFDRGVNLTLGLPFIRTSPDHGCAFDIAGRGIASCNSLIESIKLAIECQRKLS